MGIGSSRALEEHLPEKASDSEMQKPLGCAGIGADATSLFTACAGSQSQHMLAISEQDLKANVS